MLCVHLLTLVAVAGTIEDYSVWKTSQPGNKNAQEKFCIALEINFL